MTFAGLGHGARKLGVLLSLLFASTSVVAGEDRLPDHRVARAGGDIVQGWLIGPTDRYRHFVLGAAYEAAGVRVVLADGGQRDFMLPETAVFEDREPRIIDLDGDGRNEVVLVKSAQGLGASLVVLGLRDDMLDVLAEMPPIGRQNRWLNPAGFGRFSQDGAQIALVRMPHILGRLEFWRYADGKLTLSRALDGFSNHRIGSSHQRLSAVLRGSEGDLLLIPRMDRRSLVLVDPFADEPIVEEFPLPAPMDGDLTLRCLSHNIIATAPLEDGRREAVSIRREGIACR